MKVTETFDAANYILLNIYTKKQRASVIIGCALIIIVLTYLGDYLLVFFFYSDVRTILISARKKQHKGQACIHHEYKQ